MTDAEEPAGRRRVFGSLCLLVFLVNFARVAFAPLVEPFMAAFGVREGTAGLVVTLAWLGSALPRVPTGYLLTRFSRQRVVLATGAVLAAAGTFIATVPGFAPGTPVSLPLVGTVPADVLLVGAGALFIGAASGIYFIAANPLVSELYPHGVGRALGVHGTASQLAAVAAPAAVTLLLVEAPWQAVFALLAAGGALATGTFAWATRGADLPNAGTADRDLIAGIRAQWRLVAVGVLLLGLAGFVWNAVFNFYVSYLVDVKQFERATGNALLTLVFAAGVPAFLLTGRLADRVPHVPLLLGVIGTFAACLAALTVVQSFAGVLVVTALLGYAAHSLFPAMDTFLLSRLPDEHRGSAYAAYGGGMAVLSSLGSVVLGTLVEAGVAYHTVYYWFVGALVVLWAGLFLRHRTGTVGR